MNKRQQQDYHISNCLKHGVSVFPRFILKTTSIDGKKYEGGNWYVEVDNRGESTIYQKSIGKKRTLKSSDCEEPIRKTWKFWSESIDKEK